VRADVQASAQAHRGHNVRDVRDVRDVRGLSTGEDVHPQVRTTHDDVSRCKGARGAAHERMPASPAWWSTARLWRSRQPWRPERTDQLPEEHGVFLMKPRRYINWVSVHNEFGSASWSVLDDILTIRSCKGVMSSPLNGATPAALARILMQELSTSRPEDDAA
jgi:hypothetical protein